MSKNKLVFSIGLILLVMPLLGFPPLWKNFFSIAFGLTLVGLSFSVAAKRRASARRVKRVKDTTKDQPIFVDAQRTPIEVEKEEITLDQEENKVETSV